MKKLAGLKVALCQMPVIPGRPDLNAAYIFAEIGKAAERGVDIIAFPEMCVPGYLIGDKFEDDAFVLDVAYWNERIIEVAKKYPRLAVIFGSLRVDAVRKGEDGRIKKQNAAFWTHIGGQKTYVKTLQPNYRMFDDNRHFYSTRAEFARAIYQEGRSGEERAIDDFYLPAIFPSRMGEIKIGIILCEDMWWKDYSPVNPTRYFVEKGADIVFNLSCSPWTWQKNRKRHSVVKNLLAECEVPFVYVNNTGIQNNGKNIVVFDGSSTVYDSKGEIIFAVSPYAAGPHDLVFREDMPVVGKNEPDDTEDLYEAIRFAVKGSFERLDPKKRKALIGLSGGIDSALDAALLADVLGAENVFACTMPSKYTSEETLRLAHEIAANLGIKIEVVPIQPIVDAIAEATNCKTDTLAYENIQARVRMEILAAKAQQLGCVFIGNCNKVEAAFGYGTVYGDIAGFILPIGDLIKREVYQLADHLNQAVFKRQAIPEECFSMAPTAELSKNQKDPFDYGNLNRRGYHDEMVRAFVEFRKNPEWFLETYLQGRLERELKLDAGTLKTLFPTHEDFVRDLERCWGMFHGSVFKRVQAPPIPIVSKRAFGYDLRESMMGAAQTVRYQELKEDLLSRSDRKTRIAVYGGSFNPSHIPHRKVAESLAKEFDLVVIIPCGIRPEKSSANIVDPVCRKEMAELNFAGMSKVVLDFHDIDEGVYTPTFFLQERYEELYPDAEIWHVIGTDLVMGGREGQAEIQRTWAFGKTIWKSLNWAIIYRPGCDVSKDDMPPHAMGPVVIKDIVGSGTLIRERIVRGEPFDDLVIPEVAEYIKKRAPYAALRQK